MYLKNIFCQFFEYGIFVFISSLKLFDSKKKLAILRFSKFEDCIDHIHVKLKLTNEL